MDLEPAIAMLEEETTMLDDAAEADPAYQQALLDSFDAGPLTPIASCFEAKSIEFDQHSAAGVFKTSDYPYTEYCYVELLLAHAKIYVFAQYRLCSSLPIIYTTTTGPGLAMC